jgi:peptidoglycan/xylan/chitin deacetylase (PgdA/CDA1 family)
MMQSSPPAQNCLGSRGGCLPFNGAALTVEDERGMGTSRASLRLLYRGGAFEVLHRARPRRLTVLAYHRIIDDRSDGFEGLVENVSATPEAFEAQLDLLRRWFSVVSLEHLLAWLQGRAELPDYAALITFDDGYRDNFDYGLPILRQHGLPAVLFLATACVGSSQPFLWDLGAYCFRRTRRTGAALPLCGFWRWPDEGARQRALHAWLRKAKRCPADESGELSRALARALEVEVPAEAFLGQHVSWPEVHQMLRAGVAIGAHTHHHAILSRIPPPRAREEVVESKQRIEAELGAAVHAFAYPNGLADDYRARDVAMLRREGFAAAFTLLEGPTGRKAVRRDPLEIRRILVSRNDDLASFAAKVTGFTRFVRQMRRQ